MSKTVLVAIGFSEGGLKPVMSLFDSTPHDKATYIILRHIPIGHRSQLQAILQQHSKLKIVEAKNNTKIEKDTIYMTPSAMYITIKRDRLFLHNRVDIELFPNQIVDVFLTSLAEAKGKYSIAVILSGCGSDGAKGCIQIKAAGGMVIAQDPASCEMDMMPKSAIETNIVDNILLPADMSKIILHHVENVLKTSGAVQNLKSVSAN